MVLHFYFDIQLSNNALIFTLPWSHHLYSCQDLLLENVKLGEKIARNQALKENVFMMVVCVELRIPLFLVGKPGSSKSLAKAIVADAMQGNRSCGELFKTLKEVSTMLVMLTTMMIKAGVMMVKVAAVGVVSEVVVPGCWFSDSKITLISHSSFLLLLLLVLFLLLLLLLFILV